MSMRLSPLLLLSTVVLVGCSTSAKYDIDVGCNDYADGFEWRDARDDELTKNYSCYSPASFHVQCDKKTVQIVGNTIFCTTHDEKTVRIILTDLLSPK